MIPSISELIIYEDEDLIVINKPYGYFVHKSSLDAKSDQILMYPVRDYVFTDLIAKQQVFYFLQKVSPVLSITTKPLKNGELLKPMFPFAVDICQTKALLTTH